MPTDSLEQPSEPVRMKYFLDKSGVPTCRIAGRPGASHIDIATIALGNIDPETDVYAQMFNLGYVRVLEEPGSVHVDAPNRLTKAQQRYFDEKVAEGRTVTVNEAGFVASRGR